MKTILNRLINHEMLSKEEAKNVLVNISNGSYNPSQIASFLTIYMMRSISIEELSGFREALLELCIRVDLSAYNTIDLCGTGGDGIQTFNVSTVCAFVAAAAGAKVAKHGGRSVSSTCGSADVLEALGVNVNQTPAQVADCVNEIGIGFMFAPNHHSAMKYAAPVRRELGVRTLFNLLGPMTNPATARRQVMGVFDKSLTGKLARVLQQLGSEHVLVVHGADGMDEISFTGDTFVAELKNSQVTEYVVNPRQFGLGIHRLKDIQIQNAEESKAMILDVLKGKKGSARDIVLMNAGAAIYVAGIASSLQAGIEKAAEVIDNGAALEKLNQLIERSNRA